MRKIFTLFFSFIFLISYSQIITLPSSGVQSTYSGGCPIGTCSGTLRDAGGAGNYPNNINAIYQVICPTNPGNCLQVTFTSFDTEAGFDYLTIGNGPAQNSAVFIGAPANASGQIWGTPAVPFSYTANNSSGCLTFRFSSDNIVTRPGFTASISCVACATAQPVGNSDACSATFLCNNLGFNDVSNGPGVSPGEGCGGTSCVTGEVYSNWYKFAVATSGSLTFTVDPNTNTDDFDYALHGPNVNCGSMGTPLRCSYAATSGNTGLGNGAGDLSEDVSGNGWTAPINVVAGQTYMLLVNNWTAGGAGFNILFGGTATLGTPPPAVNTPTICEGQTAVLSATPVASGGTYTWNPGGSNASSISVSPTSSTTYSISYSLSGCTSTAGIVPVTVNTVPTANAGSGVNLTCSSPNLALSGSGGGTYSWSGPGITGGAATATPTVNLPGTYSLNVTNAAGCTSTVTATVAVTQNTTAPSPTASNAATLNCSTTSAVLTGGGGGSYSWSGPGITGGGSTSSPTVNLPGTYVLTVTAANGCTATASTAITQNTTVPSVAAANTGSLNCTVLSVNASATTSTTPVSHVWSGPGITAGAGTGTITLNQPGTYNYTVTNTTNGCQTTGSQLISQNITAPTVTGANTGSLNCTVLTVNASASTGASPVSYNWSGPGITSGAGTGTISLNQPGTYNYTVTNTSNGCSTTGSQVISQNITVPTVTVSGTQTITCVSPTVTMTGSATPSTCTPVWTGGVSSGANSYTATAASANVYTLTVTNPANGCSAAKTVTVVPSAGFPSLSSPSISNSITCSTFTAQAVVTSTTSNITYSWTGPGITGGASTPTVSVNTGGTYSLAVTNTVSMCTSSTTAFVPTNTTAPVPTAANTTTLTCVTTTATLTGGPTSGVTYQWSGAGFSGGTTSQNAIATAPGIYTLVVTNPVNSCTAAATAAVTQNTTAPSPTASNSSTLTCSSTSAVLTGSGGGTYSWSGPGITGGAATASPTVNLPGTYILTVTAANGCTATASTAITQNTTAPSPTASNSSTLTCSTTTAALTGTGGGSYSWSGPGITGGGSTSAPTVNLPGTYVLTVTAANGCTATASTAITQNITNPSPTASNSTTLTCTTTTAVLTGGGGGSYNWSGPGITAGGATSSPTVNLPGTYVLTVTAANGCTATANTAITQNTTPPSITATNSSTLSCTTTTATLNGTGGGSYIWSGPGITAGGATSSPSVNLPGTYGLTVTAANGCTATANTSITQNTVVPSVAGAVSGTLTCSTTTVNASATTTTSPESYNWSGPGIVSGSVTGTITVNQPGTYNYIVTDVSNGCSRSGTLTVTQNTTAPLPTASNSSTLTCTTTTAVLTGSGGGTYSWSGPGITGGATTSTPTVNLPGTYVLTVTAANGCTATANTAITQNTAAPSPTASNSATLTCSTTTAALTGSGGGSYSWSGPGITGGGATSTPTVNLPGTYVLTVTATNGCTATASAAITQNTATPSVAGANTGSLNCTVLTIDASATTSTTPVSYVWSGPGITAGAGTGTISVNSPGTYNYTVTNTSNGCKTTGSQVISQNIIAPTVAGANTGSLNCTVLTVNASSSTSTTPVSYNWSGPGITSGAGTGTISLNQPGTYDYTVTNTSNGCSTTGSQAITQNTTAPTVTVSGTQTITCASPTVSISGSSTPSTCTPVWTGGVCAGATTFTASACSPNTYTLTVTNPFNNCTSSGTVSVVPSIGTPIVTASNSGSLTCTTTTAEISATTTMTPVSYSWSGPGAISGGTSNTTGTVTVGGTYQCVVTNTLTGCASTITTFVPTNTTAVAASIAPTTTITCSTTSLTLNASPNSSHTFSWTPATGLSGTSVATPTVNEGGTYSVVITNTINGCTGSASITVTSNTVAPSVNIASPSVTTTCSNPTATIVASATPSTNVTYSWTAPGTGSLNQNNISNPVASGSGVFTVVVTNSVSGCSSSITQNTVEVIPDAAIPTVSLSSNSVTITCSNPTPSVSVTSTTSPISYSWSPASGIVAGTETTASPSFSAVGSYSVVVTNTASGCATGIASNVVDVTLDNAEPVISLSSATNNGTITCTNTFVVVTPTITPSSNLTYSWSPAAGISTPTNQSSATFTAAGVYTLAVTNTLTGCVTTSTNTANTFTVIEDNVIPTFTLGTASTVTTTCAAPNATLSASSNLDPNTIYTWLTPTSTTLTGSSISVSAAGIYSVVVTNTLNGCANSSSVSQNTVEVVTGTGIPSVTMSANTVSITCSNPTPSVSISTTSTPVSYNWSPSAGILTGTETTAAPTFTAAGSYSVIVTNTVSGCASSISSNVVTVTMDNTSPIITLSSATNEDTITCANPSVVVTPTVIPGTNLTYSWSPATGISTPLNQASATFTAAGIYSLAVTNTLTGCVSTSTSTANTFTVYGGTITPTATITAISTNSTIGCSGTGSFVTLSASTATSNVISWLPGNVTSPQFTATSAGIYSLVTMDALTGCSDTTEYTVSGNTTPPQGVDAGTIANISCGDSTTILTGVSTSTNVNYSWSGPSSTSIISGSNTPNPLVAETGSYTLTVTDITTGCQSTATVIVAQANVTASFTANPTTGISPLTVNFTDASIGATNWNWNFGDSNTSPLQNPTNIFTSGSYTVTLTASSGSCTSTATVVIVVEDGLTMEIPNVFTPNSDGANDLFTIKSTGIKEISLQIFNRWGEKLYEFAGPKASWDGLAPNGLQVPEGTYFYFVKATGFDETEIEKNGTFNLFR